MVSANHWLRGIKTYRLSWHLTRVSANHASSNWALAATFNCSALWDVKSHAFSQTNRLCMGFCEFLSETVQKRNVFVEFQFNVCGLYIQRGIHRNPRKASLSEISFAPWTPHNALQFKMAARLPKMFTVLPL